MTALAPSSTTPRQRFLERVARAFDEAGIEYVLLHGYAPDAHDSDVDVGIGRQSLDTVDLLARIGRFGRLLQRFDYDVPWCRYYVLEADEPGRRYRQLDVACDPRGVGRYGRAIPIALASRRSVDGVSVPEPAAEALYLAVKRARKGTGEPGGLHEAFAEDPAAAAALLCQEFGSAGRALADAVRTGREVDRALGELALIIKRGQHSPASIGRRAFHKSHRVLERVVRPTGLVVGLAGPDGVGKSTLAGGLELAALGAFRATARLHLTPGVLPPPSRLIRRRPASGDDPHGRVLSGSVGSSARVAYLVLDTILGWPTRVAVPRMRSTLVLLERGLLDLSVDPVRYRLRAAPRFGRMYRLLPKPELVLALDAPSAVVRRRRAELPVDEIARQLVAWRARAELEPTRVRVVDATAEPEDVLEASLDAIDDVLANRQGRLDLAATALECLGGPVARGKPYRLLSAKGQPRWLVPPCVHPLQSGLYRPARIGHRAAAYAFTLCSRALGEVIPVDPGSGIAPRVADALGLDRVELAAALPREAARAHRAVIAVLHDRELVAFGKVSRRASELRHEASVLEALQGCNLEHFAAPRVLDLLELEGVSVLLVSRLAARGNSGRAMDRSEHNALVELAGLSEMLSPVLGREAGLVPVHGDFTGWNSAPLPDGRLALWDWEEARLGRPLEDFFHWKLRRLLLLAAEDAEATAWEARHPGPELASLAAMLRGDPVPALLACLSREEGEPRTAKELSQLRHIRQLLGNRA